MYGIGLIRGRSKITSRSRGGGGGQLSVTVCDGGGSAVRTYACVKKLILFHLCSIICLERAITAMLDA